MPLKANERQKKLRSPGAITALMTTIFQATISVNLYMISTPTQLKPSRTTVFFSNLNPRLPFLYKTHTYVL